MNKTSRPSPLHDDEERAAALAAKERRLECQRRRRRKFSVRDICWLVGTVAVTIPMLAGIGRSLGDYHMFQSQVVRQRAEKAALLARYAKVERRLAMLQGSKGRSQILLEHGYVHPGERILLFPQTAPLNADTVPNSALPPGTAAEAAPAEPATTGTAATDTAPAAPTAAATLPASLSFWDKLRGLTPQAAAPQSAVPQSAAPQAAVPQGEAPVPRAAR